MWLPVIFGPKRLLPFVLLYFLVLLPSSHTWADVRNAELVPEALAGATLISAVAARDLLGKAGFIDTRILHDYLAGHLPDALHVPYKEASARTPGFDPAEDGVAAFLTRLHRLAPDKSSLLVFYCNGTSCWKSYKGAKVAIADGYAHVHWLREGMAAWKAKGFVVVSE